MLVSLHVKNFAIINEVEVYFKDHLNILSGETGAGKSIIIGSINAALGAKVSKDMLRSGADYALVELIFETKDPAVFQAMKELDLPVEDGQIIISRKIRPSRSICKINGENVTASILSKITSLLIDIHGQHEHQSLLQKSKHLEILDQFAKDEIGTLKEELKQSFSAYSKVKQEYEKSTIDDEKRLREISFLEYEANEIENAALKPGEDEELAITYKRLANASAISDGLQSVYACTGYENSAAGDLIERALRQLMKVADYDERLASFMSQITDIESLMNDFNRDLSQYLDGIDDNEEALTAATIRMDLLNHLKSKYGNSIEQINQYYETCIDKLEKYRNYDSYLEELKEKLEKAEEHIKELSLKLSHIRKEKAKELTKRIEESLVALNFLEVKFDMIFHEISHYTANGIDEAEFIISTNPGEKLKPLSRVASGGELSRIMLGIKSILAEQDAIETLIFDEIDVGISGRTAQKVSEQLSLISKHHQIICITHLPQIAAMADSHYIIEKVTDGAMTQTLIKELDEEKSIEELARILGGAEITERVLESAKEMKELASSAKKYKLEL